MTREEATEKLNRCREILEITSHMDNQNRKAFDMAVKALKQEPCGKDINVLDKIRDEIDTQDKWLAQAGYTAYNVDIAFNSIKRVIAESEE